MSYECNEEKNTDNDRKTDTLSCGGVPGYFKTVENLRIKEINQSVNVLRNMCTTPARGPHFGLEPNPHESKCGTKNKERRRRFPTGLLLEGGAGGGAQAVVRGRGGGHEVVRGGAWGRGVAVQAAGVAGAATLAAVAVDGGLQLARRAQAFLLALEGVQILHVPVGGGVLHDKSDCLIGENEVLRHPGYRR